MDRNNDPHANTRIEVLIRRALARAGFGGALGRKLQTTFVFRPGAVAPATTNSNVYATWAALFAAASVVAGPRIVEFDDSLAACSIPAGAYNFGAGWDVEFRAFGGSHNVPSVSPLVALSIATGVTLLGVSKFSSLIIAYAGAAACIVPVSRVQITFDATQVLTSGAGAFISATGGASATTNVLMFNASNFATGTASVVESVGAASSALIAVMDSSIINTSTLGTSGGGALVVTMVDPAATVSLTQASFTGAVLTWGTTLLLVVGAGLRNIAITDLSSTVAPAPNNQTTPGANTDVLAAVLTPRVSGLFRMMVSLNYAATNTNTVVITIRSHTKAAAIVVANGTATGLNCFFATANGAITYGGGTTDVTHRTFSQVIPASPVAWQYNWSGVIAGTAGQAGFTLNQNVALAVAVQDAANDVTGMTGSLWVEEVLYG